ncbi:MAG: hypothetical protein OXF50_04290 [Caldilineaceae bacterium]|nr:hypothetical protein [Caldilineaceae bacterium]MDE0080980.1 hypothetical protein [Caldilineaceae bacterium]
MPAADAVDTDSFLERGRADVVAGGQCVAGVERDADAVYSSISWMMWAA